MDDTEITKVGFTPHSNLHKIIIVQAICTVLLLLGILAVRYINKAAFEDIRAFYKKDLLTETSVDEVLGEGEQNEAEDI